MRPMATTDVAQHGGIVMKRIVLGAGLLLAAATAAHADHDVWTDMLKHHRSDDVLNANGAECRAQTGQSNLNGARMLPSYLSCMRARGWRFSHTVVSREYSSSPPSAPSPPTGPDTAGMNTPTNPTWSGF